MENETKFIKFELMKKFRAGGFTSHVKPNKTGTGLDVKLCIFVDSNYIEFRDDSNVVEYDYSPKNGSKVIFGSQAGKEVMVPINPYIKPPPYSLDERGNVIAPTNGYSLKFEILPGGILTMKITTQGITITKKLYYSDFENKDNLKVIDGAIKYFTVKHLATEDIPEDPPEIIPDEEKPEETKPTEEKEMNFMQKAIKKMQDFFLKNKWYVTGIYILILIGLGIWNLPVTIIAWILGIIGGTYLNK